MRLFHTVRPTPMVSNSPTSCNETAATKRLKRRYAASPKNRLPGDNKSSASFMIGTPSSIPLKRFITLITTECAGGNDNFSFAGSGGDAIRPPITTAAIKHTALPSERLISGAQDFAYTDEDKSSNSGKKKELDANVCCSTPYTFPSESCTSSPASYSVAASATLTFSDHSRGRLSNSNNLIPEPLDKLSALRLALGSRHEYDVPLALLDKTYQWTVVWKVLKSIGWYFKKGAGLVTGYYVRPGE